MSINPFTQHPHEIGESYWQHQRRALGFAIRLLLAGGAALVHALLPFLFVHTGSRMIGRLHASMMRRHAQADSQPDGDRPLNRPPRSVPLFGRRLRQEKARS